MQHKPQKWVIHHQYHDNNVTNKKSKDAKNVLPGLHAWQYKQHQQHIWEKKTCQLNQIPS